jgi:hypothetical protein
VTTTREPPMRVQAPAPEARVVYRAPVSRRGPGGGRLPYARALWALCAVLVVFALGAAFGRSTAGAPAVRTSTETSAAGQAAPAGAAGQATQGPASQAAPPMPGVGPARTVDDVPVGYTRTRAGAVAAATNYTAVLSSPLVFDDARRKRAIAMLAAPEAEAALAQAAERSTALLASALRLPKDGGKEAMLRAIPVAYRVDRYDNNVATVSIWQTSLGGSTTGAPIQQSWGITTVDLRWVEGDWKQTRAVTTLGPVPLADDALPTAASELITRTENYEEYRYGPGN